MMYIKRYSLYSFILALVVGLSISTAFAQVQDQTDQIETYRLIGKVVDANNGEALSDVEVNIENVRQQASGQAATQTERKGDQENEVTETTNDQGEFSFSELPSGEHTIRVDHEGYETWERKVNLKQDSQLTIELQPSM